MHTSTHSAHPYVPYPSPYTHLPTGKLWHALPAAERARWEDKARAAQAEHRRRYPDWRFRPGNEPAAGRGRGGGRGGKGGGRGKNAIASGSGSKPKGRRKGRIKDGGEDEEPPPSPGDEELGGHEGAGKGKGKGKERDADDRDRDKGKGKGKERERDKDAEDDERCEKITTLLVEGKKGRALEAAVEAWEFEGRGRGREREPGAGVEGAARGRVRKAVRRAVSSDEEHDHEHEAPPFFVQQSHSQHRHQDDPPASPYAHAHPPPASPFIQPPPASPFTQHPPSSPFAPHPPASPYSPYSPFDSPSASASPVPAPARASTLMLPPLTHMYKRSLSAPCGVRAALPSPAVSAYVSPPPLPPQEQGQGQEQGQQQERQSQEQGQVQQHRQEYAQQQYTPTHTHVRRDTISAFPAARAGYQASARRARGAYTYPPPYMPLAEPGPSPRYGVGGESWWERLRGTGGEEAGGGEGQVSGRGSVYAEAGGSGGGHADEGWADRGAPTFSGASLPPPSPPLAMYVKQPGDGYGKDDGEGESQASERRGADPYALPLPLSPVSAPAISSFSTLSGWAGDFSTAPSASTSVPGASAPASGRRGEAAGRERTSGWFQPPGWDNSVQGQGQGLGPAWGAEEGDGYKAPWPTMQWPVRGDVDMYDSGEWDVPR
ncbi:hypothetical protein B0H15DRAFT_440354 [Mycena belliarum]|uniref:HMG box domain-containing protein n=1 Tax=Mycena belliarum TaxID=1033014 RepID=A0AAD6TZ01_9AGAR|nr:hypothetical protein B0H15DRAFT_440354 [Mycena belliae]